MHNDLTNLLPLERQQALSREYVRRLCVIIVWFCTALTLVAIVLLAPTYMLLSRSAYAKEAQLAHIESILSSTDGAALTAHLATLNNNATTLSALAHASSVSATVRSALTLSRPGIALSGFTYTPAIGKSSGTLTISGIAATRDSLRGYQLTLQATSFALSANLPVSAYAKDTNIAFTITVTLAP